MRKIKEVLRLKFSVGLGLRAIARSCSIGLGTVHEYLQRAEAAGVAWPLGEDWDDDRLEAALFGGPPRARPAALAMPDFAELHRQRQLNRHVTQQLLWEEYRQANPDGYRYSRYVAAKNMLRQVLFSLLGLKAGHCRRNISRNLREPYSIGGSPCINCLVPVRPLKLGLMTYRSRTSGTVTYATARITARVLAP